MLPTHMLTGLDPGFLSLYNSGQRECAFAAVFVQLAPGNHVVVEVVFK